MGNNEAVREAVEVELNFDPLVASTKRASVWPRLRRARPWRSIVSLALAVMVAAVSRSARAVAASPAFPPNGSRARLATRAPRR